MQNHNVLNSKNSQAVAPTANDDKWLRKTNRTISFKAIAASMTDSNEFIAIAIALSDHL